MDLRQISYEQLWETLWDHSITGLALVAKDGLFLRVNPAFQRLVEYTEAELRTKTFQSITHPDDVASDEDMAGELASGTITSYDMAKRYITKTGAIRWITLRGTRITLDDGTFSVFLSQIVLHVPLDSVIAAPIVKLRSYSFKWITSNWAVILAVLSSVAIILATILEKLNAYHKS